MAHLYLFSQEIDVWYRLVILISLCWLFFSFAGYCLPIEMPPVLVQWNPVWNCTNGHCKYAWLELVSVCQECHWWGSWQLVMFLCILANGGSPTARWEHACKNGNVQVTAGSDCNVRLVTPTIWVFWAQPAFLYLVNILWVLLVGWHKQHAEYSEKSIVYFSLLIFWAFFYKSDATFFMLISDLPGISIAIYVFKGG